MPVTLDKIKTAFEARRIEWMKHALRRMLERGIRRNAVFEAVENGEIIETYADDSPFPSCLILGYAGGSPLHIVAAYDDDENNVFVITAYVPDPSQWMEDWRTRR